MARTDKTLTPDRIIRLLEERGTRLTPERRALVACLPSMPPLFRVDELQAAIDASGFHVSCATVYNTVNLLASCGILVRCLSDDECARYTVGQSADTVAPQHFILVCSACGKQRPMPAPAEARHLFSQKTFGKFVPQHVQVSVHGLCVACQRRARRTATTHPSSPVNKTKSNKTNKITKQ